MNINQVITQLKTGPNDIEICEGVSESTLAWFERAMGFALSEDFKTLYRFTNGFKSAEELFRIVSLEEIIDNHRFRNRLPGKRFYFAEYLWYCDMWSVEMLESKPLSYSIFCSTGNKENTVLTHSLAEFLNCFLANGVFGEKGLCDWEDTVVGNGIAS